MAISYNDWKKQYESLDAKGKAQYEALAKNSALGQQYMQQYKAGASTTIGGTPVGNSSTTSGTPTIGGTKVGTTKGTNGGTNNSNGYTIGGTSVGNSSASNNGGNFTIGGQTVGAREGSKPNDNGTVVGGYTTPKGNNGSILQDASPVDAFGGNSVKSNGPKSIFDKPTNPVTNFSVLGINPQGEKATQKGNTPTKQTTVSTPKNQGYVNPKQVEWDYQDNSQARMDQIADNLNKYKQTNPELFKDYDTFYNFFIAGKGRSEDQKRFLDQYYADYKQNEKWNNMSADDVGSGIANGTIPEDYINTVASTDPNRAAAIKDALKNTQDGIANAGYLDSLASAAGFRTEKSSQTNWASKEGLFIDEDNNWIDDRREHYATQEERELNDGVLEATRRLMSNHVAERDQIDNIIDQYPDIDYGTAVLLANDRNQKLYKQDDALNISIAQMNGTLQYLQKEREERNKAGADTINQLQKNYQMYMQYSPEGIKELAEAQYEANNPSLEKAETGTDLDKQRAVDAVISEYFDKYGSIIERPKTQVVQDALDYAKKNGVSLSDAINETFTKYLKAKPGYQNLATGGSTNGSWSLEAIKDSEGNIVGYVKIDKNTGTIEGVSGYIGGMSGDGDGGYQEGTNGQFTNYTPISQRDMVQGLKDFMNSFVDEKGYLTGKGGQCGHFVNDYLEKIGIGRLYTDPIDKKKAITNTNVPAIGAVAVMDSKTSPQYGHVAIVGKVNKDGTLTLLESNWGNDEKIHIRENVDPSKANIYGYFNPSIAPSEVANQYGYGENPMSNLITKLYSSKDINADQKKDLKFADQAYGIMYDLASNGDIDYLLKSSSGQKMLANLKNSKFIQNDSDATGTQVMDALKNGVTDQRNLRTVNRLINLIELKLRKTSGAAIAASEWNTNFSQLLPGVGESYDTAKDKYTSFEKDYLMAYFNSVGGGKKGYKYEALFSPNSPYYKKYNPSKKSLTSTDNNKGTWSLGGVNNTQINNYDDLYYYMGI